MKKQNVLFLCTGNSARSQMAEAFLRKYAGDRFDVYSAGLRPAGLNPFTVRVMDEVGLDVREQTSNPISDYMGRKNFHYVITVCAHADKNCPTPLWHRGIKLHWPFDDPAVATGSDEQILTVFRIVRDQIQSRVQSWLENLTTEVIDDNPTSA